MGAWFVICFPLVSPSFTGLQVIFYVQNCIFGRIYPTDLGKRPLEGQKSVIRCFNLHFSEIKTKNFLLDLVLDFFQL